MPVGTSRSHQPCPPGGAHDSRSRGQRQRRRFRPHPSHPAVARAPSSVRRLTSSRLARRWSPSEPLSVLIARFVLPFGRPTAPLRDRHGPVVSRLSPPPARSSLGQLSARGLRLGGAPPSGPFRRASVSASTGATLVASRPGVKGFSEIPRDIQRTPEKSPGSVELSTGSSTSCAEQPSRLRRGEQLAPPLRRVVEEPEIEVLGEGRGRHGQLLGRGRPAQEPQPEGRQLDPYLARRDGEPLEVDARGAG